MRRRPHRSIHIHAFLLWGDAMLTIRQLEIFIEVVRAGSFRRCAAQLDMSPISVGDHVKALEDSLETRLFVRRPGGPVGLTQSGRLVLEHAERILHQVTRMQEGIGELHSRTTRCLRIHIHPFTLVRARPRIQEYARERNVKVDVELALRSPDDVVRELGVGSLDLSVMLMAPWRNSSGITLQRVPNALFVGEDHPLLQAKPIGREDVHRLMRLALPSGTYARALSDEILSRAGLDASQIGLESDDIGTMLEALRRNEGFLCGPISFSDHFGLDFPIRPLLLDFPLPDLEARLLRGFSARRDRPLELLEGWITATFTDLPI